MVFVLVPAYACMCECVCMCMRVCLDVCMCVCVHAQVCMWFSTAHPERCNKANVVNRTRTPLVWMARAWTTGVRLGEQNLNLQVLQPV